MILQRLFLVAMLLCSASIAFGAERMLAVTEEFPPFNYTENGKLAGYGVELAQAVLEGAGVDYAMASYPWARAYEMAQQQPNVLIFSMTRTPDREKLFHWIAPLAKRRVYLYKLAARTDIKVQGMLDLRRYSIATNRGDVVHKQLKALGLEEGQNIDLSDTDLANVRKLAAGRVELIAESELSMRVMAASAGLPMEKLERTIVLPGDYDYYIAASLKTPEATVRALRAGYLKAKDAGFIKRLAEKFAIP
ncbi:transporter substrate-binding domain-containing protein [Pseudoduganella sp. LjRoot289]|uniref:substrate-binding periplasmic protein n=1 Tax=Pseudoduganella sp. LjRoot289 TaxID=3342314 RepID=UPI003ECDF665